MTARKKTGNVTIHQITYLYPTTALCPSHNIAYMIRFRWLHRVLPHLIHKSDRIIHYGKVVDQRGVRNEHYYI